MTSISGGSFLLDPSYFAHPQHQHAGHCPSCNVSSGANHVYVNGSPCPQAPQQQPIPNVVYVQAPQQQPCPQAPQQPEPRHYEQPQLIYVQAPPAPVIPSTPTAPTVVKEFVDRVVQAPKSLTKVEVMRGILFIDDYKIDLPLEVMNNAEFREKFSELLFMKMSTDCNAANAIRAIVSRMQHLDTQGITLAGNTLTVGSESVDITNASAFGNLNGAIQKIYDVMKGFKFNPDNGELTIANLPCGEEKIIKFGVGSLVGSNTENTIAYKHGSVTDAGLDISKMAFSIELQGRATKLEGRVDQLEKDLDAASFDPAKGEITIGKKVLQIDSQGMTVSGDTIEIARSGIVDIAMMPQQLRQDARLDQIEGDLDSASFDPAKGEITIGKKVLSIDAQAVTVAGDTIELARGGSVDVSGMPFAKKDAADIVALQSANAASGYDAATGNLTVAGKVLPLVVRSTNGLTTVSNTVKLGGTLTQDTTIDTGGKALSVFGNMSITNPTGASILEANYITLSNNAGTGIKAFQYKGKANGTEWGMGNPSPNSPDFSIFEQSTPGGKYFFYANFTTDKVGILTSAPTHTLSVKGDASNATGAWAVFSDPKTKTIAGAYEKGLDVLKHINPIRFSYNGSYGLPNDLVSKTVRHGVNAAEVAKVLPEAVSYSLIEGESIATYDSAPMVYVAINAIKELLARVESLEAQLSSK